MFSPTNSDCSSKLSAQSPHTHDLSQPFETNINPLTTSKLAHSNVLSSRDQLDLHPLSLTEQTDIDIKPIVSRSINWSNSATYQTAPTSHVQADSLGATGVNVPESITVNRLALRQKRWIQNTIDDQGLRTTIAKRSTDGTLDRTDLLKIFDIAKDGNQVDGQEFHDLKALVNGTTRSLMPESVQNLAGKVINGDRANRNYQDVALGNLKAGSSDSELTMLVSKWFLGTDHPFAWWSKYHQTDLPLFSDGASYQDIKQGDTGDCYLLASLAAVAKQDPQQIQDMFTDNGDGTYTVRFFRKGQAEYVTVDSYLPEYQGNSIYADYSQETWVALAEKAYAQLNESGWLDNWNDNGKHIDMRYSINSYDDIGGGWSFISTEQITGKTVQPTWSLDDEQAMIQAFQTGSLVTLGSKSDIGLSDKIIHNHAYALIDYNAQTQTFTLYNPWGVDNPYTSDQDANPDDGQVELTWTEMQTYFREWDALQQT